MPFGGRGGAVVVSAGSGTSGSGGMARVQGGTTTTASGGAVVGNWSAAACVPIVGNHMVSEWEEGLVSQSRRSFLWHDCARVQYGMQYF